MKFVAASLLSALALAKQPLEGPMRFDGHKVVRVTFDETQLATLEQLAETFPMELDFWKDPSPAGWTEIRVPGEAAPALRAVLKSLNMDSEVVIEDVQKLLDQETFSDAKPLTEDWYRDYHSHQQNIDWARAIGDEYDGQNGLTVDVFSVGNSHEGRELRGLRFTAATASNPCTHTYVYNGHQHAREWLTTPVVQYVTENLLKNHVSNSTRLESSCFHVLPTVNADGYEFSIATNRMWRKSRKPNAGSSAMGTDLNRNWPYQWGGTGASTNPASDTYRGVSPEDNVEVKQWMDYIRGISSLGGQWDDTNGMEWYTDFHTHGNYILTPWGYTSQLPSDHACQICVGYGTRDAIAAINGNRYLTGPSGATLYPTSGSAPDTAYGPATDNTQNPNTGFDSVVHSWTIELSSGQGFTWPASRILEICYEMWAGMEYLTQEINSGYTECSQECS